jgi:hypothetical protein
MFVFMFGRAPSKSPRGYRFGNRQTPNKTNLNSSNPGEKYASMTHAIISIDCSGMRAQAHFVAPNTSAHIRYAVYFRVHKAGAPRHQQEAILNPWLRWADRVSVSVSSSSSSIGATGERSGRSGLPRAAATDSNASTTAAVADVAVTAGGLSPEQAAKVATLVTMAAEMGLVNGETELVAALEQNGWDENRAIGSLF